MCYPATLNACSSQEPSCPTLDRPSPDTVTFGLVSFLGRGLVATTTVDLYRRGNSISLRMDNVRAGKDVTASGGDLWSLWWSDARTASLLV
jgi:hypothetical protein